ncbi:hypothetical protein YPPY54_0022, partial [Yersinia pestis PY-54]
NMLGGADNTNGELPSYITGANTVKGFMLIISACTGFITSVAWA